MLGCQDHSSSDLAGAKLPSTVYIDGVDQTSFLLADQGATNRAAIFYYMRNFFTAYRVGSFKNSLYIAQQTRPNTIGGFLNDSLLQKVTMPHVVDLYTDPKERMPKLTATAIIKSYLDSYKMRHQQSLTDYPPAVNSL